MAMHTTTENCDQARFIEGGELTIRWYMEDGTSEDESIGHADLHGLRAFMHNGGSIQSVSEVELGDDDLDDVDTLTAAALR